MFNLFKEKGTGALLDTRSESEKEKDYHLDELVTELEPVNWQEKKSWRQFPIFDQNGSGSCVAQTIAKMLGVMYWIANGGQYVHFSATHVYQRRRNKPSGGMIGVDALQIAQQGVTLEDLVPSQNMTDSEMDSIAIPEYKKKVGEIFKAHQFVQLATRDIDAIASTIQKTGKPVMVWYWFKHNEWTTEPKVRYPELTVSAGSRHSVTAVDFLLKDGKKCLVIDDSWGTKYGEKGQRFISEDFHSKRNFFAAYLTKFNFDENGEVPSYKFTVTMRQGDRSTEVVALQNYLKAKGYFPTNVDSTGYFGSITKKAVQDFQKANGLVADGIVGKNTLSALNK